MGRCKFDAVALGSPGVEFYWKLVDLFVYSVGPFIATFLINIAIFVSISRAHRRRNKFASPRVRFLTKPDCPTRKGIGADAEREVAFVVGLPARSRSRSEEITEAPVEDTAPVCESLRVIKRDAIPKSDVPRNQTSKFKRLTSTNKVCTHTSICT